MAVKLDKDITDYAIVDVSFSTKFILQNIVKVN